MNAHPKIKIAAFNGSTASKRVPKNMDGIEDELATDKAARRAVERCSERVMVKRPERSV